MEKYKQEMEKRRRPNPLDRLKMERQGPDSTIRRSHSANIEPRLSMTTNAKKNLQGRDHRSTSGREKWRVYYTLTRVGADITSSLGMKTTTELCRQKHRRIQACSYNRVGIVIYIMGVGGGRRQEEEGVGNPVLVPVRSGTE